MLGYAAFALCGPKYVRDICPNKAKPALGALHTVSLRGRGKLLVGFVSLQSQCCDSTVRCAGTVVFYVLQITMCVSLLCFCPEKSGTWWWGQRDQRGTRNRGLIGSGLVTASGTGRPKRAEMGLHKEESILWVADKPAYIVPNKSVASFWVLLKFKIVFFKNASCRLECCKDCLKAPYLLEKVRLRCRFAYKARLCAEFSERFTCLHSQTVLLNKWSVLL